ncbi:MAG: hypothetical protein WCO00_00055 [Rhodospirillaceae bacterium]
MAAISTVGGNVQVALAGAGLSAEAASSSRLQVSAQAGGAARGTSGSTAVPTLVPVAGKGGKTTGGSGFAASTKPAPPPTFAPVTYDKAKIQMPFMGPVYYNKAGSFSQPVQTLGQGALVNITA